MRRITTSVTTSDRGNHRELEAVVGFGSMLVLPARTCEPRHVVAVKLMRVL
jgi:hypothetical protein